jgi:hypothetical protein
LVLTEPNREALVRVFLDPGTRLTKKLQGLGTAKQSVGGIGNELDDLSDRLGMFEIQDRGEVRKWLERFSSQWAELASQSLQDELTRTESAKRGRAAGASGVIPELDGCSTSAWVQ